MKWNVGDKFKVKVHHDQVMGEYGDYVDGDIGVITEITGGMIIANFPPTSRNTRENYSVAFDELTGLSKLEKILS